MLYEEIKSLAQTPDPIIPENLPRTFLYLLHPALSAIANHCGEGFDFENPKGWQDTPWNEKVIWCDIDQCTTYIADGLLRKRIIKFIAAVQTMPSRKVFLMKALLEYLEGPKEEELQDPISQNPFMSTEGAAEYNRLRKKYQDESDRSAIVGLKQQVSVYAEAKYYADIKSTVFDYILEESGSLSFARVHDFIQHNENYELSSRGKGVYDGSFAWIARELGIHRNTVWRAFRWMSKRKLVTKIGAQDHRKKKNSRWYVCTSIAQNLKLWSLQYQGKKG